MNTNFKAQRLMSLQAIAYSAYGVDILDENATTSPLQFDAFDLWLGADFDFILDNILDDFFNDVESDLKSVWSTNKSEQESAQISAQRSADADALGLSTDDNNFMVDGMLINGSDNEASSLTNTTGGVSSATTVSAASLSHDLDDHSGFKFKGHLHHPMESRYSDTESEN